MIEINPAGNANQSLDGRAPPHTVAANELDNRERVCHEWSRNALPACLVVIVIHPCGSVEPLWDDDVRPGLGVLGTVSRRS